MMMIIMLHQEDPAATATVTTITEMGEEAEEGNITEGLILPQNHIFCEQLSKSWIQNTAHLPAENGMKLFL